MNTISMLVKLFKWYDVQGSLKLTTYFQYKNTKLAVVEAKSNELDVSEGVAQAKLYAEKLRRKQALQQMAKHLSNQSCQ